MDPNHLHLTSVMVCEGSKLWSVRHSPNKLQMVLYEAINKGILLPVLILHELKGFLPDRVLTFMSDCTLVACTTL